MSQVKEAEQQRVLTCEEEKVSYVLVMPGMKHRNAAVEYITEFIEVGDDIDGLGKNLGTASDIVKDYDSYGKWLYWLYGEVGSDKAESGNNEDNPKSFTYFYIEEPTGRIIGTVNLRAGGQLAEKLGNLGYAIRPSLRGKGYGTMMVESALTLCGFMGMEKVTAVCHSENKAGLRLLDKCGFIRTESVQGNFPVDINRENGEVRSDCKSSIRFERIIQNG